MCFEVFVNIEAGTPPKNCSVPQAVSFFVEAEDSYVAAKKGIFLAEKMRERHPRKFKGAYFSILYTKKVNINNLKTSSVFHFLPF